MQANKIFVCIYCKIYVDHFPDDIYQILPCLKAKSSGKTAIKKHTGTKQNLKASITDVREILESNGWQVIK